MNKIIHSTAFPRRACHGFSLFEVLITVVVVGIGLLGLAGLQFAGLRASNNANQHTIATQLAQDVIERIRANRRGASTNFYDNITLTSASGLSPVDCNTGACNSWGIRQYDRAQWSQLIDSSGTPILPNASIAVNGNGTTFTVTITWGNTATPFTYTVTTSV